MGKWPGNNVIEPKTYLKYTLAMKNLILLFVLIFVGDLALAQIPSFKPSSPKQIKFTCTGKSVRPASETKLEGTAVIDFSKEKPEIDANYTNFSVSVKAKYSFEINGKLIEGSLDNENEIISLKSDQNKNISYSTMSLNRNSKGFSGQLDFSNTVGWSALLDFWIETGDGKALISSRIPCVVEDAP